MIHPLRGNGSGSPWCGVLASCGSCTEQLPVGGSSQLRLKSVETQGLAGSCRQPGMNAFTLHHAEGLLLAPACSCGTVWRQGLLQSTFPLCHLPAYTEASQMPSTVTWFSFRPSPRWHKLTTKSLLAAAGEGLEQGASTQLMEEDAFCPHLGSREMCGCADRPGRSWSPPSLTSSYLDLQHSNLCPCWCPCPWGW